jgi:hypothetical protein
VADFLGGYKSLTDEGSLACEEWWRTVSARELRESFKVVGDFIESTVLSGVDGVEVFARSLALQQLYGDGRAVLLAAEKAYKFMPVVPPRGAPSEAISIAEEWLAHGWAIDVGLTRCEELLGTRYPREWGPAVNNFRLAFHLLERCCVEARVHDGLSSSLVVTRLMERRPRKA